MTKTFSVKTLRGQQEVFVLTNTNTIICIPLTMPLKESGLATEFKVCQWVIAQCVMQARLGQPTPRLVWHLNPGLGREWGFLKLANVSLYFLSTTIARCHFIYSKGRVQDTKLLRVLFFNGNFSKIVSSETKLYKNLRLDKDLFMSVYVTVQYNTA